MGKKHKQALQIKQTNNNNNNNKRLQTKNKEEIFNPSLTCLYGRPTTSLQVPWSLHHTQQTPRCPSARQGTQTQLCSHIGLLCIARMNHINVQ